MINLKLAPTLIEARYGLVLIHWGAMLFECGGGPGFIGIDLENFMRTVYSYEALFAN